MTTTVNSETAEPTFFEITLELRSPICLAATVPAGNLTRTLDYIPGSSARGALAAVYRAAGKPADDTFKRLFLDGEVTYGNLYCNGARPVPLSARSCKYEPGFKPDRGHGVVDWLLPWYAQSRSEQHGQSGGAPRHEVCSYTRAEQQCGAPLEPFTGFYDDYPHQINSGSATRVLTRSATDDRLHTAEQGLLYSLEVLDPTIAVNGLKFQGAICATEAVKDLVKDKLLEPFFTQSTSLFIGTARSRGLGELQTTGYELLQTAPPPLSERLRALNNQFRAWGIPADRLFFSLTLHSDLILQDEFFHPCAELTAPMLAWEAGWSGDTAAWLRLEQCFTGVRMVSGWNAMLRMPKTDATAIKMGAVFLYSTTGIDEPTLVDKLTRVEAYGLGARRAEGFGRVVVCDPFHLNAGKGPV